MATIIGTRNDDTIAPDGVSQGVRGGIPSNAADTISDADCIRSVFGPDNPLHASNMETTYRILPTLDQAVAEARKAGLVGL